jgi:shikimate kinase
MSGFGKIGWITYPRGVNLLPAATQIGVPGTAKSYKETTVTAARTMQNIALIGFMGTGKSSVGRLVSHSLQFTFLDTDQVIESRAGKSITEIFKTEGEAAFRVLECKLCEELRLRRRTVIATGGGFAANNDNLASLKTHALVVCLWASAETILDHVRAHSHRPLLAETDPLEKIRSLLAVRKPYYTQADVLINTERRSLREVAQQVMHQFHLARSVHP